MTPHGPGGIRLKLEVGSPTISMRVYYSSYHLWAARHQAAEAQRRETQLAARPVFDLRHRTHVTGSILSAVAFLEAAINEVFQDAADSYFGYLDPLTDAERNALAGFWEADVERKFSVLEKYQMALCLLQKTRLARGAAPYQEAAMLVQLRNELVHFKPKTRSQTSIHKLQRTLSARFSDNPLMEGTGNPYFPDKCLGSGCAAWAVEAATSFADSFFARCGLAPNYQLIGVATSDDV